MANESTVRIHFGKNAAKIYDAHCQSAAVYEMVVFINAYAVANGLNISRNKRELAGEIKLHNLLYDVGYKRESTQHADLEYAKDGRWYVNVASVVLG